METIEGQASFTRPNTNLRHFQRPLWSSAFSSLCCLLNFYDTKPQTNHACVCFSSMIALRLGCHALSDVSLVANDGFHAYSMQRHVLAFSHIEAAAQASI